MHLGVTAGPKGLELGEGFDARLAAAVAETPRDAPAIVLIHGFKFDPFDPHHDPHELIFAPRPARACWKLTSWPAGLAEGAPGALTIGFGWPARARSGVPGQAFRSVYHRAAAAGALLAGLIARLRRRTGRRVDILAHSLGARVALSALPSVADDALGRLILLGGAERVNRAEAALAGRHIEVINVVSRRNALFDRAFEVFAPGTGPSLRAGLPGALTLDLDAPETLDRLAALGAGLGPARAPDLPLVLLCPAGRAAALGPHAGGTLAAGRRAGRGLAAAYLPAKGRAP